MQLRTFVVVALLALAWLGVRRAAPQVDASEGATDPADVGVELPAEPTRPGFEAPDGLADLVLIAQDRRGRPVPRLVVQLEHAEVRSGAERRDSERTLVSPEGRFELDGLGRGRWRIELDASPWRVVEPPPGVWVTLPRSAPLEVVADPPARVEALVEDAAGHPVERVAVEFRPSTGSPVRAFTDAEGRASSGPVAPGLVVIDVKRGGAEARGRVHAEMDAREVVRLRLPAGSVRGVLVDARGAPVPDTWIEAVVPALGARVAEVMTHADGRFHFPLLDPGDVLIGPSPPAARRADAPPRQRGTLAVVRVGVETEVRVVLENPVESGVLRGSVLLGETPLPDVGLTFLPTSNGARSDDPAVGGDAAVCVRTDRAGAYRLELPHGGRWIALLEQPGRASFPLGTFDLGEDDRELALRVPLGELEGRVVRDDGAGVAGATIEVTLSAPWTFGPLHAAPRRVTTAADGSFVVTGLAPGPWVVHARPATSELAAVASRPIDVRPEARPAPVELVTSVAGALRMRLEGLGVGTGDAVRVDLRDAAGRPVTAGLLELRGPIADGLLVPGLAPGTYRYAAHTSARVSGWSEPFVVRAGETTDQGTTLRPGGELVVEVRDGSGQLVPAAFTLLDESGQDVTRLAVPRSEALGTCRLGPLTAGLHAVIAVTIDGDEVRQDVAVEAGRELAVRLAVER